MVYAHLPAVASVPAAPPELGWHESPNRSSRNGLAPSLVFVHVWGGGSFSGVVEWLCQTHDEHRRASAHVVYAGELGADAGKATQLVPWSEKAWTECDFNSRGLSIESADAIWTGRDPAGFARLARMVGLLLHLHRLPARWIHGDAMLHSPHGFCRHGDAGQLGCGHLYCPTSDMDLWAQFVERVVAEVRHGGFRDQWGAH